MRTWIVKQLFQVFSGVSRGKTEADVEVKHWERNSDIALHEIDQEFESQRLQPRQANQRADQTQRDKRNFYVQLEMKNRLFRENQAKSVKKLKN